MKYKILIFIFFYSLLAHSEDTTKVISVGNNGTRGFTQLTETSIQDALDEIKYTGGKIVIKKGNFQLKKAIRLVNSKKPIEIIGEKGSNLILQPAPNSMLSIELKKGDSIVYVKSAVGFETGNEIEIQLKGEKMVYNAIVVSIEDNKIILNHSFPLSFPKGSVIMQPSNIFHIVDGVENLRIMNLMLDLQKNKHQIISKNHSRQCAIFVEGPYTYADGVKSYCKNITIENCVIKNCHHRGIALYGVTDSSISNNIISNTGKQAEAIDIDHFCERIDVKENTICNANAGIELNDASSCTISKNKIKYCKTGINCWWYEPCKMLEANYYNHVVDNLIEKYEVSGIMFGDNCLRNVIQNNICISKKGLKHIYVKNPDDNTLYNNKIIEK